MLLWLAHLRLAHAWLWDGPQQTSNAPPGTATWRLEPTAAPIGDLELFKRQNSIGTSVCSYVSGDLCE